MACLYEKAPKGERAYGKVLRNRGKNTTLLTNCKVVREVAGAKWHIESAEYRLEIMLVM